MSKDFRRQDLTDTGNVKTWWYGIPDEELRENAWERQMNLAGAEAFERSKIRVRSDGSEELIAASETRTGRRYMQKLMPRVEEAVEECQRSMVDMKRVPRSWRAAVMIVPASTVALLAMRVLFDMAYGADQPEEGTPLQAAALKLAEAIETEANWRNWISKSKEKARAYAEENNLPKVPKSQAERLIEEAKKVNRMGLHRWKKTFEELNEYEWSIDDLHFCGSVILKAVVRAIPEVFELYLALRKGTRTQSIRVVPEFRSKFDDKEAQIANMQVVRKPMITRPIPWSMEE